MYAPAGRGGRGAEVEALERRAVRDRLAHRPEEELREVRGAAVDVPTHEVAVPGLEGGRALDRAGQHELPEPGGEAFDLCLDALRHVLCRAVRDVTVSPGRVLAGGRARVVEERLL